MIVRRDKYGLYIRSRWWSTDKTSPAYRPGTFPGHSHAWNTTTAGVSEGDRPRTRHVDGAPFIRIEFGDGEVRYWGSYKRAEGDFPEEVE